MGKWTHYQCAQCWNYFNPDHAYAVEGANSEPEYCCFCGKHTTSGITVQHNPKRRLSCKGEHQ